MAKHDAENRREPRQGCPILPVPPLVLEHHGRGSHGLYAPMGEWVQQKRVPPVLLLTGAAGIGKRALAYFLAQWILCEQSGFSQASEAESLSLFGEPSPATESSPAELKGDPGPCGKCPSCHRALTGNWVDFLEITPDDPESETLKIDQFRDLKAKAGFGAHEGAYRIILIPNSDHMTVQAANSMLKILEEPPARWIFFLTASDPSLLLPTIVSRCQVLRLKPFQAETLTQLLIADNIPAPRAQVASQLAQGSWGKAWELAQEEQWGHRKAVFDFLRDPSGMLNHVLDWATINTHYFNFLVDQLEQLAFDLVRWSLDTNAPAPETYSWRNADGAPALAHHAKCALRGLGSVENARSFWLNRAERLAQARQDSSAPLNRKILTQDLLLPWLSISG